MPADRHATAAHEAAHVVVGVALGLRLRAATVTREILPDGRTLEGYAWFGGRNREAFALMYAAGVAWDRALRTPGYSHSWDATAARALCSSRAGYVAVVKASAALLAALKAPHTRVTEALLEGALTHADLDAIAAGA
jgi:hypothetical protein